MKWFYCKILSYVFCIQPQSGGQAEMEEGQLQSDTQRPHQEQPREGDQSPDQTQLQTSASVEALSENLDQGEPPVDGQEKGDSAAQLQAKLLWKPIPPLLPVPGQHRSNTTEVRDQSCQTEERLQQTCAGSHGHNTGEECFLFLFAHPAALIYPPKG